VPTANHHNSFDLAFSFVLIRFAVQNCRRRSTVAGRQYGALDTDEFRMVQQDTEVNTGFQIRQRGLLYFLDGILSGRAGGVVGAARAHC